MPVGYYGFEPLIQSTNQVVQQKDYTGEALSQLGGQIKQSLSDQAMRAEASKAAPLLQQQFEQGFGQIQSGNLAGGLGQIYGASAQYAANPLLSQYAQQAQQGAGLLAHGIVQGQLLGSRLQGNQVIQGMKNDYGIQRQGMADDTRMSVVDAQQGGLNDRQQNQFGQQDKHDQTVQQGLNARQTQKLNSQMERLQDVLKNKDALQEDKQKAQTQLEVLKSQLKMNTTDPMVPIQKALAAQKSYHDQMTKLTEARDKAESDGNIPAWQDTQRQINKLNDLVVEHGSTGDTPFISEQDKAKLEELKGKLKDAMQPQGGASKFVFGDNAKLAKDYQAQIDAITTRANDGLKSQAQAAQEMQQANKSQFTEGQIVKQGGQTYQYTNGNFVPVQ